MQLILDLPDELVDRLAIAPNSISRHVLETLTVAAYQAERITSAEVGRILGMASRWEVVFRLSHLSMSNSINTTWTMQIP